MQTAIRQPDEPAAPPTANASVPGRLSSLDTYRGFVMFLMAAELLHLSRIARSFPDNPIWQLIGKHTSHVEWVGCSLHDLIQPSFTFMVGVALPFSIASRVAKGNCFTSMFGHALWRSLILILLGVFLRSVGAPQTNWTFEDTLTQIGLGYTFAFLLAFTQPRTQWIALGAILLGYWAAWALYPLPGPDFDWQAMGVPKDWPHHLSGFAQHWDKNSNLGTAFDQWFMNLFPRQKPYVYNGGGYLTLSFIPTLGTMLFGLIAGRWLRSERAPVEKFKMLVIAGVACLALGMLLHVAGVSPIVKRIWTPGWTIFSAGWAFLFLAAFYGIIDLKGYRKWAFPLIVIGMNSIAMYCLVHLIDGFIIGSFKTHLGQNVFDLFGKTWAPLLSGIAALSVLWLILLWMHRRKLFLKV